MNTDMIVRELPRIKTDPLPTTTVLIPVSEERRRDDIIKQLTNNLNFYTGTRVRAVNDEDFAKDGYARIVGVITSYAAWKGTLKDDELKWTDNPMLVAARYEDSGFVVNATTNYFKMA